MISAGATNVPMMFFAAPNQPITSAGTSLEMMIASRYGWICTVTIMPTMPVPPASSSRAVCRLGAPVRSATRR